jgi:hypothetical protein
MVRYTGLFAALALGLALTHGTQAGDKGKDGKAGKDGGVTVDKEKRLIIIDAKMAPRKLEHLKEIYPIEVIACWPHPKGQKAHETVVTIEAKPSDVHQALVDLGLKPGTPIMGESEHKPMGPAVKIYIEFKGPDGDTKKVSIDKTMVDNNGKPFPKSVEFRFTGSVLAKTDPTKGDTIYGADKTGTLIAIFPVTDQTVFQTSLTMAEEKFLKLEVNTKLMPKEGTAVKLVIEVPPAK